MENSERIIDSFRLRETLNPKVWDNHKNIERAKLKKVIKARLSKIADEFVDYLGEDIFVEDIVLTGSLVNYNWSQYSDFDLHILIDFKQFGELSEIKKENFELKKESFNNKHNIKIYGYDVELYPQDTDEEHFSSGMYSILTDEWINQPKKEKFTLDMDLLKKKIKCWVSKINSLTKDKENLDYGKLKKLKDKLKTYRKAGLENKGEISYENLVFKYLRRSGDIEKLMDSKNQAFDKELSIESKINEETESVNPGGLFGLIKSLLEMPEVQFLKKLSQNDSVFEESINQDDGKTKDEIKKLQSIFRKANPDLMKNSKEGVFDEKMTEDVKKFQSQENLPITGKVGKSEFKKLTLILMISALKSKSSLKPTLGSSEITDENFYKKLLINLGAPVTDENLKFLYAWRQSEGKAGKYNPFNTTYKLPNSSNFNSVGVKNYNTIEDGFVATLKTLKNGRYNCIIGGLKNDIGAKKISTECLSQLKTWGTGELVGKVLNSYERGAKPKPSSLMV